jgi:hypothetical protein
MSFVAQSLMAPKFHLKSIWPSKWRGRAIDRLECSKACVKESNKYRRKMVRLDQPQKRTAKYTGVGLTTIKDINRDMVERIEKEKSQTKNSEGEQEGQTQEKNTPLENHLHQSDSSSHYTWRDCRI